MQLLRHNSYRTEFLCYGYGISLFTLFYFDKWKWVVWTGLTVFFLLAVHLYYYLVHVRDAVQEVRYTTHDFSKRIDQFLIEHVLGEEDDNDNVFGDCVICLENFSIRGGPHTLYCPCKENYYHRGCIREWLLKSATCPICRSDLKSKVCYEI